MSRHERDPKRAISRRELLRRAGLGLGALSVGRYLGGSAASAADLSASAGAELTAGGGDALALARVWPSTAAQAAALARFDDTHLRFADGSAEFLLWPGDRERLDELGMEYEITVSDVVARDAKQRAAAPTLTSTELPPPRTEYRRLAEYEADLRALAQQYPDKARLLELPNLSLEGRKVYGIEIASNFARADGRPVFYMDGVHHAREWPASEMVINFAFDLLENYGTDSRVTGIVDGSRTILIPVVNVDGFHHSRESLVQQSTLGGVAGGQEGYWRKNRRSFTGLTVPVVQKNPDAYGVDPNRNYAYEWGDNVGGSSGFEFDQTTRGEAPFSEPESANVRGVLLSRPVTAMITHHTYGRLILRPWGHIYEDPPDEALLKFLGAEMAKFNNYTSQKGIGLYATTGTTDDWAYAAISTLGYTFEHGTSFHAAYTSTIPQMYNVNRGAFLLLAEATRNPAYHSVLRARVFGANQQPVQAEVRVRKQFSTPLWQNGNGNNPTGLPSIAESLDLSMTGEPDGRVEFHLNPSTRPFLPAGQKEAYQVTISAYGYQPLALNLTLDRGQVLDLGDVVLT